MEKKERKNKQRIKTVLPVLILLLSALLAGAWVFSAPTAPSIYPSSITFEYVNATVGYNLGTTDITGRLQGDWGATDLQTSGWINSSDMKFTDDFYYGSSNRTELISGQNATGASAFIGFESGLDYLPNYWTCDGSSDDVQINNAVTYVNNLGNGKQGKIFFDSGSFDISAIINLTGSRGNITFQGSGIMSTRLIASAPLTRMVGIGSSVNAEKDQYYVFRDIQFDGNSLADGGIITASNEGSEGMLIERCLFKSFLDYGVRNGHGYMGVVNSELHNIGSSGGDCAINADGGYLWHIINCRFWSNWDSIKAQADAVIQVTNCQFYNDARYSINIDTDEIAQISDIHIRGNGATDAGIRDLGRGTTVSDFYIEDCVNYGIDFRGKYCEYGNGFIDGKGSLTNAIFFPVSNSNSSFHDITIVNLTSAFASNGGSHIDIIDCDVNSVTNIFNFWASAFTDLTVSGMRASDFTTAIANMAFLGSDCSFDSLKIPFVEGSTLLSAAGPWGWEIDANNEYALALGHLSDDVQQVIRWKIWATSLVADADYMTLEVNGFGGASDEAYTAETISIATLNSTTTNFAVNDGIYWILTSSNDADVDDLVGGDTIMIMVKHEAASGGAVATDAVFLCVELEYV